MCNKTLCGIQNLTYLSISGSNMSTVPVWFTKLNSLTYLDLSRNPSIKPDNLGRLGTLQSLFVLPIFFFLLLFQDSLKIIYTHNNITEIPAAISDISSLYYLFSFIKSVSKNGTIVWKECFLQQYINYFESIEFE